jgi:hypothetical protein
LPGKLKSPRCFDFAQHRPPLGVTRQAERSRGHLSLKTRHLILKSYYLQESGYSDILIWLLPGIPDFEKSLIPYITMNIV